MQQPGSKRIVIALALFPLVAAMLFLLRPRPDSPSSPATGEGQRTAEPQASASTPGPARSPRPTPPAETAEAPVTPSVNLSDLRFLPAEKVEEYLQRNQRNASSLLAAFHALNDTNLLREAAAAFPNDPAVQWTVLARDAFPEQRREWLEKFKESSPSNSLANYLSAADYFKNNQPEAAIKELIDASGKLQFKDYALDAWLNEEDLARFAGRTGMAAVSVSGWNGDLLPTLTGFSSIANGITEAHKQYMDAADATSAERLIQLGLGLAARLRSGEGGSFLISQMFGASMERRMIDRLDPSTPYDFLGGQTPDQRRQALAMERNEFRELARTLPEVLAGWNDAEVKAYVDYMRVHGETETLRWLRQQQNSGR